MRREFAIFELVGFFAERARREPARVARAKDDQQIAVPRVREKNERIGEEGRVRTERDEDGFEDVDREIALE